MERNSSSPFASPGERAQRHDLRLPARLAAPGPGWTVSADVIVVGSGIAGLTTALRLRKRVDRVLLVTKTVLSAGSTLWAQGGIAAALHPGDSPAEHLHDTLVAGVGVCDVPAVTALVNEGPARVRELVGLGAEFDLDAEGSSSSPARVATGATASRTPVATPRARRSRGPSSPRWRRCARTRASRSSSTPSSWTSSRGRRARSAASRCT